MLEYEIPYIFCFAIDFEEDSDVEAALFVFENVAYGDKSCFEVL